MEQPSVNGVPATNSISKLRARVRELEASLEEAESDRDLSEDELEQHILDHAQAEQERGSGRFLPGVAAGDLVLHLRHQGRSCARQQRLAKLKERLPRWLERYRLELIEVREID
jgi:hypothetical protein